MLKFYYNTGPNPVKVALLLEELGVPYEAIPVETRKGEQFTPQYLAINPNSKAPSLVDGDATVFDSNAILLYLAEKTQRFLPAENTPASRGQLLSWLMFVASGIGPFSGQAVHYRRYAPHVEPYSINRYDFEAERHWLVLDSQLAKHRYTLGDQYTILDMAVWGWARILPRVLSEKDVWSLFPNVKRLVDEIDQREAARGVERLLAKHTFKLEMDEEAVKYMLPQLARLKTANP